VNRRRFLAAASGVGLTAGSAYVATEGLPGTDADAALPRRVETLDAPGSTGGEATVTTPDAVTVVDLFATWCAPCDDQLAIIDRVRGEYDDVSFVSVTNERLGDTLTREDLVAWWREHGGAWTLGVDPGSDLLAAFGANGLPYVAIVDADGTVAHGQSGLMDADELRARLDALA